MSSKKRERCNNCINNQSKPASKVVNSGKKEKKTYNGGNSEVTDVKNLSENDEAMVAENRREQTSARKKKDESSVLTMHKTVLPRGRPTVVNKRPPQLHSGDREHQMANDLEIKLLQEECQELRSRLGCLKEGLMGRRPGNAEQLLKQSQKELLWLQRQLSFISDRGSVLCPEKQLKNDLPCLQPPVTQKTFDRIRFLEDRSQALKTETSVPSQAKLHWRVIENELKDVVQKKNRLSLDSASLSRKALQYDQVKPDYDQLRETLSIVTEERDLAVKEKYQLQAKLENLEQVLKHMREAAERRQQLELEHEQALAVLNAKQQEIELLQKAQVEAKKEHEGAVQLLENTLDSMQAKVLELEEKCRTQSQQFNLLSKELEKFRQQAGKIDLLSGNPSASGETPASSSKSLSQLMNGIATPIGKGHESPSGSKSVISEVIRPIQISSEKPELLSVKPTFLLRSTSSSPRRGLLSEMDNKLDSSNSRVRYSGKVRLCVARYSYNPFDGPNENPEAELPLSAGKYLYVYGDMDEDGFYEGELLDGQRGLVPSNFVDFVQDEEVLLSSSLDNEQDRNFGNQSGLSLDGNGTLENNTSHTENNIISNGTGTLDVNIDEIGEDIVPYPRKINLIKQLAKSVIIGWEPPVVPPRWGAINSYNVLVDKEIRMNILFGSRTKALIEKLNLATCTYRISIQSVTEKGTSDELRCSLLVGKDVIVAPSQLKVDNITQISAELSWLPSNSNYSHVIFLNEEEFDIVKAACYKYQFFSLKPNMGYKVKTVAKPHQMPWQLPLEQREKKEAVVDFCTLPAGPPDTPKDLIVQAASAPGTLQVSWKPPALSSTGTSNGANVTGYAVYAKGQKVAEVMFPTAETAVVELARIQTLEARELTVRTLSAQGESEDSSIVVIPSILLVPPTPLPKVTPKTKPLASARAPETKDLHMGQSLRMDESWEQTRSPSPVHGHTLEPPLTNFHSPSHGRRSPSPQRILPQPQGAPIPNTVAKAIAREAAQRVAENNRIEKRSIFSERSNAIHLLNSDEEEDGYDSPHVKRRGASVDEFLRGSELGRQPHYCQDDDYHTESSRGSDLSDIMEEDEEELYSEMQLEDGGRRRHSATSHNALKLLGNPCSTGRTDRADHSGRRLSHGNAVSQRPRPMMVPSIEITMDSNSEGGRSRSGSEGNISPVREDAYYRSIAGRKKWPLQRTTASDHRYDSYCTRDHLSPDIYEESETDLVNEEMLVRIFVALFDYDPSTMSPNPDAAEEELPFKEGQIMKVYGDKDADGFYRAQTCGRAGLIPCNMVSEIQIDDEEMIEQLLKQGFLPLNTPVEKIERNRRSGRQHSISTRRMVALYDYDPRESSPNVDVEAELTFCAGDIINVYGEIDEDGFYYGELNGQKGLVPSNFLEEVPDDVEVYLSEAPCRYSQDTPIHTKTKRVPPENIGTRRAPSPTVQLHHSGPPPVCIGSGSPVRGRDLTSKKKKGILSKGRKLLKKLGAVK
ncbi:RIMS-binding protein 2 isoform X4 [Latimeria chalumnae]|uniref:RIMS-binding protein 2 isoform X4 n=1 Tax=Latimeria chalumnae TaxID=7897 RepID=UPI0006D8F9F1|nr:PREDICTED: RIMS-binding protein 2 isoform X2 [Latimeria chalumnae]|eukprot:XP_014345246.1 PREDICTED: RIMS-binding protein 2 isoform X2 [Latimeria chalumnae]